MTKIEEMINAFAESDNLKLITEKITAVINNPIVIISPVSNIIAYTKTIKVDDPTWNKAVNRGYITLEFSTILNKFDILSTPELDLEQIVVTEISPIPRHFFKLSYNDLILGYLNVTCVNDFDQVSLATYSLIVKLLSKELYYLNNKYSRNIQARKEEILLDLHLDSFVDKYHFLETVTYSKIKYQSSFVVIAADLSKIFSYNANNNKLKNELQLYFKNSAIIIVDNLLLILYETKDYSFINEDLQKSLSKKHIYLGISDIFYNLYDYLDYEKEAITAAKYKHGIITLFDDIKINEIVNLIPKDNLKFLVSKEILVLRLYDKENKKEYLNTLEVYLKNNRSVKRVSEELFLHRNTINYRIQKIKDSFNIDLDDHNKTLPYLISILIAKEFY